MFDRRQPGQDLAREPVHDRHEIEKSPFHGDIRDVGTPDLVGPVDDQIPQQIRIFPMLWMGHTRAWLLVDRPQPHNRHEPPDPLTTDFMSQAAQMPCHLPRAIIRRFQELGVDQPHQRQIGLVLWHRPIVHARPVEL